MTTADYLEQLQHDREDLVDNLETKGITGLTGDETFTELVPEVLNIETTPDTTDLRSVINMTDAGITTQTPFSDYSQKLYDGYINTLKDVNTLVDNMPQNTYTGEYIDIESINGLQPVKTILTKESTQDGTPTPSNPIEIKTIKGIKNLTDTSVGNYEQGGIDSSGNKTTTASNIRSTFYAEVKPNTKYTIKVNKPVTNIRFAEYNSNKTFLLLSTFSWVDKVTIITRSDTKYIIWIMNYDNTSLTDEQRKQIMEVIDLMLIEGEQQTPYVSYNKNFIYEKIIGKNKYNKIYTSWYRNNSTDFDNETTDNNVNYVRSNSFKINGNKTYTISGVPEEMVFAEVRTYNENKEYLGSLNTSTFTLNSNVKYISLLIDFTNYSGGTNRYDVIKNANIQIEEGTTATTYEANKDYPVILLNDNEIAGIGDYKDELIIDFNGHCWLNKKVDKVVLNGDETIFYASTGNWTFRYTPTEQLIYDDSSNYSHVMCNYFEGKATGIDLAISSYQRQIVFRYDEYKTGSSTDFKNWLSTHNTIVYYVLDTPILIDLQYDVDLRLFNGTNTITNSENADMEIKYIKDTYE